MPVSTAAIPSGVRFLGVAKETTRGTAVAPSIYIPLRTFNSPKEMPHYANDEGIRGSAVKKYDMQATQIWSEPDFAGDVFVDSIVYWLYMLFGQVATTGAAVPYAQAFTVLNDSSAAKLFQPPSYTLTDFYGSPTGARQIPGFLVSDIDFKGTATGLLEYTVKGVGFKTTTLARPTPTFGTEPVKPAWQGVVQIGGVGSLLMENFNINIKRSVHAIPTVNGSVDPAAIFAAGDMAVSGKMDLIFIDDTEYNRFVGNTSTSLDINFTLGTGTALRSIRFHASKVIYNDMAPAMKEFIHLPISFECVANTTDVGVSGGFGPIVVTVNGPVATL